MASTFGSARGTVRLLAAAGIGAVVLACAAAPGLAAPRDGGLEELWREFPLDAQPTAPVPQGEPARDRADVVRTPPARRLSQPVTPVAATQSDSDESSWVLLAMVVLMMLAVLVVLAVALIAALRLVGDRVRGAEAQHPFGGLSEGETPASEEPVTRELRAVGNGRLALAAAPGSPGADRPADEPTHRELREAEKALLAVTSAPDGPGLKQQTDQPTTRELRSADDAEAGRKAAADALKLKQTAVHESDPLKLKAASEEPDDGPRADALKEKLARQRDDEVVLALKTAARRGGAKSGFPANGRPDTPSTGGAE